MHWREVAGLIAARDERGLELLMERYGALLRYVISPILSDEREREECFSDCCMRVWENISSFDEGAGSWTAWLTTIARNAALNRARSLGREGGGEPDPQTASGSPTPEEALLLNERRDALLRAVSRLSAGERELFYRRYYYMQPGAQIAAELGSTERAVEGRLYRMRKKLRKELAGWI